MSLNVAATRMSRGKANCERVSHKKVVKSLEGEKGWAGSTVDGRGVVGRLEG